MTAQWSETTTHRRNRYEDWAYRRRAQDDAGVPQLCPVMIRLKGPDTAGANAQEWSAHLEQSLRAIAGAIDPLYAHYFAKERANGETFSPFSYSDLNAFRLIAAQADAGIQGCDSVRAMLEDPDQRLRVAAHLAEQSQASLDYLMIVQLYLPESFVYTTVKSGGRTKAKAKAPAAQINPELLSWGDVVFVGLPIRDPNPTMFAKRPPPPLTCDDKSVMIGIIDGGFPYAHEKLRRADGTSRVDRFWVQMGDKLCVSKDFGITNGYVLSSDDITDQIKSNPDEMSVYTSDLRQQFGANQSAPIRAMSMGSGRYQPLSRSVSHGMHVLGTALEAFEIAGSDLDAAKICLVELPFEVTSDTSGSLLGTYYVQAVRQLMQWADEAGLPLVVNMSYGMTAGPKNADHPAEVAINRLIDARSAYWREKASSQPRTRLLNTNIVLPAGNSRLERTIQTLTVPPGDSRSATWMVMPDDFTSSFVEIWVAGTDMNGNQVELTVRAPDGTCNPPMSSLATAPVLFGPPDGPVACLYADKDGLYGDGLSQQHSFFLAVAPTAEFDSPQALAPSGRWEISLKNKGVAPVTATLMAQRDDTPLGFPLNGRQSFFEIEDWDEDPDRYKNRASDQIAQEIFYGADNPTFAASPNGNAIASTPAVRSVGALMNAHGSDDGGFDARWVPSPYSSNIMRTTGDPGPNRMVEVDRSYLSPGKMGYGTLSGTKIPLPGTSIAAPQVAGRIAAEYAQGKR